MRFSYRSVPIALLILGLVSFGVFIPWLGFYWDDWAQLFAGHVMGTGSFWAYFASDRPFSAWTHVVFFPLMGTSSTAWHLLTLILRVLTAIAAWWTFSGVWSRHKWQVAAASLVFLVYPVFTQQSISVAYHQHLTQYALYFGSLGCMVWAYRYWRVQESDGAEPKPSTRQRSTVKLWLLVSLGLIMQVLHLAVTEFFTASEFLRPVLLWLLFGALNIQESWRMRIWRVVCAWSPYLVVLSLFVIWRLFILELPGGDPNTPRLLHQVVTHPIPALKQLISFAFWDSMYTLVANWSAVFQLTLQQTTQPVYLMTWIAGLVVGGAAAYYLARLGEGSLEEKEKHIWIRQAAVVGALALLLGPVPVWLLGGFILNDPDPYHADRYALAAMPGAALVVTAFGEWLGKGRLQKGVLLGLVIGLAVGFHLRTANAYRWLWIEQQRFYWQLSWRAPALQPGTALITEDILFPFQGNFATASAVNLLYPQTSLPDRVDYWVFALRPRLETTTLEEGDRHFNTQMRTMHFTGKTPQSLLLANGGAFQGCLWVLRAEDRDNPHLSRLVKDWLPASNLNQIKAQGDLPGFPPVEIFGNEPQREWCYFFQKAELARQLENWTTVVDLGDQARALGYTPKRTSSNSPREWLPFIEGYLRSGRLQDGLDLAQQAVEQDGRYRVMFCPLWRNLRLLSPAEWSCGDYKNP